MYMRRMGGWVLNTLAFCHEDIQVLFVHSASVAKQFLPDQFPTPCSPHSKSATQDQEALFSSSVPHSLVTQTRPLRPYTSLRSSYLAFDIEPPCRVVEREAPLQGEGGELLSYRDARGLPRSSRSSSLVYPLLCTMEALRSGSAFPPASATFSATSSGEGGQ